MKKILLTLLCAGSVHACYEPAAPVPADNNGSVHIPSAAEIAARQEQHYAQQTPILQARNPEKEARASINKGEKYFLCGAGRGSSVPGIPAADFASVRENCPVRCLDGVSDALYGENHRRYLAVALAYSERWNRVMVEVCR